MRKMFLLILLFLGFSAFAQGQRYDSMVHIVPQPASIRLQKGEFVLKKATVILHGKDSSAIVSRQLASLLEAPTGFHLSVKRGGSTKGNSVIILRLNKDRINKLGDEGYRLKVSPDSILIHANAPNGLFYGVQTLLQLLPPDIESSDMVKGKKWSLPCVDIVDYPRFKWRGLMLDVSRHFFDKQFVEAYINEMAKYKFNVFHWHLTDDQGWRIQIDGLPKLTSVGAWRVPRTGKWWSFQPPAPGEKASYGGYYTQEDIREVVEYARRRFVTIVPEVDVPAHSLALIAAYPNLSCTKKQYSVNPGSRFVKEDNVLCVANDSTWIFLNKIFGQIAKLFPGPYIHVGGDEANLYWWQHDTLDQLLMKREGIKDYKGLQGYFEKKLEKIIVSKGKKMIGWDEIVDGGLAPEATVMSWRGTEGGIKAARMKHHVIMTPTSYCYLDLYQGDPLVEPDTYSQLRLSTCYQFEPVPPGVDLDYILGGQGNLWTESVANGRHAEYMTWPRAMALSEALWSPDSLRNWNDFVARMQYRFKYMDAAGVKYAESAYDPIIEGVRDANDSLQVRLSTEIPGLTLYYTFDGSNPDNSYPRYGGQTLDIPKGASEIRVISYRGGKPVGHQINCPVTEIASRVRK